MAYEQVSLAHIEERLLKLPHEIGMATEKALSLRREYVELEAKYENEHDRIFLETKAKNPQIIITVKELEAISREACFALKMQCVSKEAEYKAAENKAEVLKMKWDAARSAIKLRVQEMSSLGD